MSRALTRGMVLAAGLWLISGLPPAPALAGPARYDKETRSFRFTYTFADLPGGVGSVVGTPRKPTREQEDTVKGLVGRVSDVLSQVTNGRARIGQLDFVDDIKNSDLVISLVGKPASPGWATMRAIDGRPGQIVIYYQSLQGRIPQDIVNTAAHEICHYVFGLADEYNPGNFPGGCPRGTGPGCLMDNYNAGARGFLGRLCQPGDHNNQPTQRPSCRELVDKFFADRGVTEDAPGSTTSIANAEERPGSRPDPRVPVIESAIAQVRARRIEEMEKGRSSTASLRSFARQTLRDLIERFNRDNPNKIVLASAEARVLEAIVKAGEVVPLQRPASLDPRVFEQIRDEAERLGREVRDLRTPTSRQSRIRSGLTRFIAELVRLRQIDPRGFAPSDQRQLIDQLARDVSRDPAERGIDRLVGITDRTTRLQLSAAEDIIRILDALGEPGTRQRLEALRGVGEELRSQFGIVGRDSTQFGLRRTRIITPDPIVGPIPVLTQGGVFPYTTIRDRSTIEFSRLVSRSKIQLVAPAARGGAGGAQPLAARIELPFGQLQPEDPLSAEPARVDIQDVLADTIDQLERDRLENIVIVVPPGGLPNTIGEQIPIIRSRFGSALDSLRVDMVLVGAEDIETELRDAVVDSHGSVLTVTDIDEIGAIAQRLKNDQSSGSWVIVPQLGRFDIDQARLLAPAAAGGPAAASAPAPEDVEGWVGAMTAADQSQIVDAINTARALIDMVVNQHGQAALPRSLGEETSQAIRTLDALAESLNNLAQRTQAIRTEYKRVGESPNPEGYEALRGPNGLNARLLVAINQAKTELARARVLLQRARTSLGADDVARQLNRLALVVEGDPSVIRDKKIRDEFRKQLRERLVQSGHFKGDDGKVKEDAVDTYLNNLVCMLERAAKLGPNLSNLARVIRGYEHVLEASYVKSKDNLPIYKRVDRRDIETRRLQLELANVERTTGLASAARIVPGEHSVRLARFYAEGNADFELILGLSQELPALKGPDSARPRLRLLNDLGVPVADTEKVGFDEATSTLSLLVWRVSTPPLNPGWYTPVVTFEKEVFEQLEREQVNFTFSVGSNRPNIQLITGLAQGPDSSSSGTLNRADGPAVIEVQVSAGSSVLGAHIFGFAQAISKGFAPIEFRSVEFRDDGADANGLLPENPDFDARHCDRAANDGIYTAFIPLIKIDRETEFRVFVQADTTDGEARYIGLDDPNRHDAEATPSDRQSHPTDPDTRRVVRQSTDEAEGRAMRFQRATTVHFRARP